MKILLLAPVLVLCGCATVLDEDGALAMAPYNIDDKGRIVVEARIDGQGPFEFALDTGASISIVFDELRDELSMDPVPGKAVLIHGMLASGKFPLVSVSRLELGREVWADPRIASLPRASGIGANIDGILGVNFLHQYAVGLSTQDRVIRLYPPDLIGQRSYRGWASIQMEPQYVAESGAALYALDIELGGQKIPALLDLGGGLNMLNPAAVTSLGLTPLKLRDDTSLSGAIETAPVTARLRVDEVTTGRVRWRNEEFTIAELEIFRFLSHGDTPCAILGAELFTQRDFIIDFDRSRLLVKVAMEEADADMMTQNPHDDLK